jgi:hypothetical protein
VKRRGRRRRLPAFAAAGPRHAYWRDTDGTLTGTAGATVLGAYLTQRDGSLQDQGSAVAAQACSYVQVRARSGAALRPGPELMLMLMLMLMLERPPAAAAAARAASPRATRRLDPEGLRRSPAFAPAHRTTRPTGASRAWPPPLAARRPPATLVTRSCSCWRAGTLTARRATSAPCSLTPTASRWGRGLCAWRVRALAGLRRAAAVLGGQAAGRPRAGFCQEAGQPGPSAPIGPALVLLTSCPPPPLFL